ncbi:hypothetical protein IWW48_001282 [Coemansia sp. RSA 1200]|nr:hypothetical protein IWW48_001282 [Coemansia sp. RSA 1200]
MSAASDRESERTLHSTTTTNRGPDTTGLYTLLDVERSATPSQIKRAYRRLALVHHPDRNINNSTSRTSNDTDGSSRSSGEAFVRIQYAYDVLSDARKRRIYDRYGEMGVRMAGRVGGALLDPQVTSVLSTFAFASAAGALLMIVFFALLARRVDHLSRLSFSLVFVPLWAVDLGVVAGIAWFYVKGHALFSEHGASQNGDEPATGDSDSDSLFGSDVSGPCDDDCQLPAETGYGATASTTTTTSASIDGIPPNARFQQTDGSGVGGPLSAAAPDDGSHPATNTTPLLASHASPTTNNTSSSNQNNNTTTKGNNNKGNNGTERRDNPKRMTSSSAARKYRYRAKRRRLRQIRGHAMALLGHIATPAPVLYLGLLFAFQILIVLRLDNHVSWSVWRIVSPWLCIEAIHFALLTLSLVETVCSAAEQAIRSQAAADTSDTSSSGRAGLEDRPGLFVLPPKHILVMAADTYWWLAIRVSMALLVLSKLDPQGTAHAWSWALVFFPLYLPFARWMVMLCFLRKRLQSMGRTEAEVAQNERAILGAYVAVVATTCILLYSFVALLVWKLSLPQALRMALVLVPAFVVLSLCCCFCSCVSLCLSYGISATLDEEERMESADTADPNGSGADGSSVAIARASSSSSSSGSAVAAGGKLVPANRRIG